MTLAVVRVVALVLLALLVVIYGWLAWRSDPRLASAGILPKPVALFFDINPLARSFPAFLLLGLLGGAAVAGLGPRLASFSLVLCLLAPVLKDLVQVLTATRHFHLGGTLLGVLGALAGWGIAAWLARLLSSR